MYLMLVLVSSLQEPGKEIIDGLRELFRGALEKYFDQNGEWPARVVVFRDGVGDGQMDMCQHHEAPQFKVSSGKRSNAGISSWASITVVKQARK